MYSKDTYIAALRWFGFTAKAAAEKVEKGEQPNHLVRQYLANTSR